jgi:hypothetical protein
MLLQGDYHLYYNVFFIQSTIQGIFMLVPVHDIFMILTVHDPSLSVSQQSNRCNILYCAKILKREYHFIAPDTMYHCTAPIAPNKICVLLYRHYCTRYNVSLYRHKCAR